MIASDHTGARQGRRDRRIIELMSLNSSRGQNNSLLATEGSCVRRHSFLN
jgi:hypothetical protein